MTRADYTFTLMGSGSSGGVPRVGNDWGVCDPSEPKNRRTRCGAMVERHSAAGITRVLIDTPPDLREQLLREDVCTTDALLMTHEHADQAHGLDDMRVVAFKSGMRIPTHMLDATKVDLFARFRYCFEGVNGYPAILDMQPVLKPLIGVNVSGAGGDVAAIPLALDHGDITALGFRFGKLAYCNDVHAIPDDSFEALRGVEIFVVDALRYAPHPSHANLETALDWAYRLGAKQTILTNLHIDMDYKTLVNSLPEGVLPGYDGMKIRWTE